MRSASSQLSTALPPCNSQRRCARRVIMSRVTAGRRNVASAGEVDGCEDGIILAAMPGRAEGAALRRTKSRRR